MMNLAEIENGIVINTIVVGSDVPEWAADYPQLIPPASVGWRYVNGEFLPPIATPLTAEELRAQMPDKTPREFRDILIDEGILTDASPDEVTQAILQLPEGKERTKILNAWEYMTSASRLDPNIDTIGSLFGLTPGDIDNLWTRE